MNRVKKLVHAEKVYKYGYTGKKIRIALLDTGIAPHADLIDRPVIFRDFVNGRKKAYDDNGHGTHIAGILCGSGRTCGGEISGMAPGAELVVLKVLDEKGNGSTEIALNALEWLRYNREKYDIRLLNFSVGYLPGVNLKDQHELLEAVDDLWDQGIGVVTAAGNNGPNTRTVTVPGISRKVITVGASDDGNFRLGGLQPGYSGRGPTGCCIVKPEVLAPGTNIRSLSNRNNGYVIKSGTSMAAPVVCGAMALALEKNPDLTPALLKLQLYESVVHVEEERQRRCWGTLHVDNLLDMV